MARIELRAATEAEILAVFCIEADDYTVALDGQSVAFARFQTVEDRRWAMMNIIVSISPRDVARVFYLLKRRLMEECQPVYVLAQSVSSPRLLRLLGMEPTGEKSAGKDVWVWTPGQ